MESKNKFKNIDLSRFYYFDNIIRVEGIDFDNILLNKKSCENILIYDTSYKTFMGVKPLRIRFDQVYGSLKFMMKLEMNVDIKNYLIIGFITNFMIRLIIL